jgi:hypothetical protein
VRQNTQCNPPCCNSERVQRQMRKNKEGDDKEGDGCVRRDGHTRRGASDAGEAEEEASGAVTTRRDERLRGDPISVCGGESSPGTCTRVCAGRHRMRTSCHEHF